METSGGRPCPFLLGLSGTADDLVVFVRAIAATAGLDAQPRLLPFGTLRQHLHVSPPGTESEVILLLPWDLAPECDWRTGFPENADLEAVIGSAAAMVEVLSQRKAATYLYLPAALPPVFLGSRQRARFAAALLGKAMDLGARILPADLFDLGAYPNRLRGGNVIGLPLSTIQKTIIYYSSVPYLRHVFCSTSLADPLSRTPAWHATLALPNAGSI